MDEAVIFRATPAIATQLREACRGDRTDVAMSIECANEDTGEYKVTVSIGGTPVEHTAFLGAHLPSILSWGMGTSSACRSGLALHCGGTEDRRPPNVLQVRKYYQGAVLCTASLCDNLLNSHFLVIPRHWCWCPLEARARTSSRSLRHPMACTHWTVVLPPPLHTSFSGGFALQPRR